jgi:LAO/AO transport system kinase
MAMEINEWVERIRAGDPRALARALTAIEGRTELADQLLRTLFPFSGKSRRIGITGAPGAGKSTLVDCLVREYRKRDRSVAVVAIDPTSPYTGGAVLGDRVRMQAHHADPGVYIRSMASRGALGGLAPTTADVTLAIESAGYDVILVETVVVGQAEVDVVKLAPLVAVVLTPSMGDDIQTIKAGIMEIADVFVINTADQQGADRIEEQLLAMISLSNGVDAGPAIVRTVAVEGTGVEGLIGVLDSRTHSTGREVRSWNERLSLLLRERLVERMMHGGLSAERLENAARAVAEGKLNPYEFVDQVIAESGIR